MTSEKTQVDKLENAFLSVDRVAVGQILDAQRARSSPTHIIDKSIVPVLERIGSSWEGGNASLSQVYMSGRIIEEWSEQFLSQHPEGLRDQPNIGIAVLEDNHALGKKLVSAVLMASGYEIKDYGAGIGIDELTQRVLADQVEILLISVLMLRSALRINELRLRLRENSARVRIIVGGAPFRFDRELWKEIGADACGVNASDAISIVKKMVKTHVDGS